MEEEKEVKKSEKKEIGTYEKMCNRKWNWMIMKQAWKLYKAKGTSENFQFHKTLGINNNMYYKIN